jgi:hypothetical protein
MNTAIMTFFIWLSSVSNMCAREYLNR